MTSLIFYITAIGCCFLTTTFTVMAQTDKPESLLNLDKFLNDTDSEVREFTTLLKKHKNRFRVSHRDEFNRRLEHYRNAKKFVEKSRGRFKKAKFRMNKFSLMSKDEHKKHFGVVLQKDLTGAKVKRNAFDTSWDAVAPDSFDFRSHGKVTPIKNQGPCGSCWSFTVAATIESQYLLRTNQSLDLSEQSLVNCNEGAWGCNGGNVVQTFEYVTKNGIATESCLPYTIADGTCTTQCDTQKYYIGGYNHFGYDESKFAEMLYNYGPASVTMYVPPEFMYYDSGILDLPKQECIDKNEGLHAMTIVGYTPEYWIIKNSWDSDWGEDGYVRIKRGIDFCWMTLEVAAPYLNLTTNNLPSTVPPIAATTRPTLTAATTTTTRPTTRLTPSTVKPTTRAIPTIPPPTTRPTPPILTNPPPRTVPPVPPTRQPPPPHIDPIIRNECKASGDGIRTLNDATRTQILNIFNNKRSELAKGQLKTSSKNKKMIPISQNYRKLIYNCTIENYAQQYVDTCTKPNAHDTHMILLAFPYRTSINDAVTQIVKHAFSFPNDFQVHHQERQNKVYATNAEFAFDEAISIGCGYSNNPCFTQETKTVVVCGVTPLKPPTAQIFTIGCSACKADHYCTKSNYNKCDASMGLCYA